MSRVRFAQALELHSLERIPCIDNKPLMNSLFALSATMSFGAMGADCTATPIPLPRRAPTDHQLTCPHRLAIALARNVGGVTSLKAF
jgi:hypothetical protein